MTFEDYLTEYQKLITKRYQGSADSDSENALLIILEIANETYLENIQDLEATKKRTEFKMKRIIQLRDHLLKLRGKKE